MVAATSSTDMEPSCTGCPICSQFGVAGHRHRPVMPAGRRAFVDWRAGARARRVRLVAGLEHAGDPRQPDNHHRH
jgi:hypothetical protein